MAEDCIDPNEPTVDNESLECTDLVSTDCIISEEADIYLRYGKGITMSTILGVISRAIQKLKTAQSTYLPTYTTYVVALDQDGTSDPTEATVITNSASLTPTLTRVSAGEFTLVSTGAFIATKTVITPPNDRPTYAVLDETSLDKFYVERVDDNTLSIKTAVEVGAATTLTDGLLDGVNTILEIKIYN